jgi:competence protein ComEA
MHTPRLWKTLAALAVGTSLATLVASAPVAAQASPAKNTTQAASEATQPIDINAASQSDFERLPGVGPSRAKAIVEMREQLNGFRRVEDLMRVKGIGRKTFQKLSSLVTLGAVPPAKAGAVPKASGAKP